MKDYNPEIDDQWEIYFRDIPLDTGSPILKDLVACSMRGRLYANPPPCHEVVNEDDHRDDKQKVDQPSCNMKCKESREP